MEVIRDTDLPAEPLWTALADIRSWPQWLDTMDAVVPVEPDRPEGLGAAYLVRQPRLPENTWLITDWRPGRGFTWEARRPGIRTTAEHSLEPTESGTRIRLTLDFSGPLAVPTRLTVGRLSQEYVDREAAALEARAREIRSRPEGR